MSHINTDDSYRSRCIIYYATLMIILNEVYSIYHDTIRGFGVLGFWGFGVAILCLMCVMAGALVGLINGLGVSKFKISPIIMTLATGSMLYGLVYILGGGRIGSAAPAPLQAVGKGMFLMRSPIPVHLWLYCLASSCFVLSPHDFWARRIYAYGQQSEGRLAVRCQFPGDPDQVLHDLRRPGSICRSPSPGIPRRDAHSSFHLHLHNGVSIEASVLGRQLERRSIYRGVFSSVTDLRNEIHRFIEVHNATSAKPFTWTKGASAIIESVQRAKQSANITGKN